MVVMTSKANAGFKVLAGLEVVIILSILGFFAWLCQKPNERIRTLSIAADAKTKSMSEEQVKELYPETELIQYGVKDPDNLKKGSKNYSIKKRYSRAVKGLKNKSGKWKVRENDDVSDTRHAQIFLASFSAVFSKMSTTGVTFFFVDCFRKVMFIVILAAVGDNGTLQVRKRSG